LDEGQTVIFKITSHCRLLPFREKLAPSYSK
jgi:hypothetical protein